MSCICAQLGIIAGVSQHSITSCGLLLTELHHSLCLAKKGGECQGQAILGRFPHYHGHHDLKIDVSELVAVLVPFCCQYRHSWS